MKIIYDYTELLTRMAAYDESAFVEFESHMCEEIMRWLTDFGFDSKTVENETPRCLLELIVLVVERRAEIHNHGFLQWCHVAVRAFSLAYWREQSRIETVTLSAAVLHESIEGIDGTRDAYKRTARILNVSPRWLRRRHRKVLMISHRTLAQFRLEAAA